MEAQNDLNLGSYMDALDRQVDVIEELVVVLDGHAGREEDHHLLLAVLLQEGEQQQQPLLRRANDVTLKKSDLLFRGRKDNSFYLSIAANKI